MGPQRKLLHPGVLKIPKAAVDMKLAWLLRQRVPEDTPVPTIRKLAEAQLTPKFPSNPRLSFPLLASPRRLFLHPSLILECSICMIGCGLHRSKETLLPAEHTGCSTLTGASHWTQTCSGPSISPELPLALLSRRLIHYT